MTAKRSKPELPFEEVIKQRKLFRDSPGEDPLDEALALFGFPGDVQAKLTEAEADALPIIHRWPRWRLKKPRRGKAISLSDDGTEDLPGTAYPDGNLAGFADDVTWEADSLGRAIQYLRTAIASGNAEHAAWFAFIAGRLRERFLSRENTMQRKARRENQRRATERKLAALRAYDAVLLSTGSKKSALNAALKASGLKEKRVYGLLRARKENASSSNV